MLQFKKDTLFVTVGIPGCGKSTFLKKHFRDEEILCADNFRLMLSGVTTTIYDHSPDQGVTREAFEMLYQILEQRMKAGLRTVLDATNVNPKLYTKFLHFAGIYNRPIHFLIFDIDYSVCVAQNASRKYIVPSTVVERMNKQMEEEAIPWINANHHKYTLINEGNRDEDEIFSFYPAKSRLRVKGSVLVIGDIHGQKKIFDHYMQYAKDAGVSKVIFVGDIVDRGPGSAEILKEIFTTYKDFVILVMGNHERNLLSALKGERCSISYATSYTYRQILEAEDLHPRMVINKLEKCPSLLELVTDTTSVLLSHFIFTVDPYGDETYQFRDREVYGHKMYKAGDLAQLSQEYKHLYGHVCLPGTGLMDLKQIMEWDIDLWKDANRMCLDLVKCGDGRVIARAAQVYEDGQAAPVHHRCPREFVVDSLRSDFKETIVPELFPADLDFHRIASENKNYIIKGKVFGNANRYHTLKYNTKAFIDNLEASQLRKLGTTVEIKPNPMVGTDLEVCRGLTYDHVLKTFVSVPFRKFYNVNENIENGLDTIEQLIMDEKADGLLIAEKVNGFLGIITVTPEGDIKFGTTGNFDQGLYCEYVEHLFKKNINRKAFLNLVKPGTTICCEAIISNDKYNHIFGPRYEDGLYLLGFATDYLYKGINEIEFAHPFIEEKDAVWRESLLDIGFKTAKFYQLYLEQPTYTIADLFLHQYQISKDTADDMEGVIAHIIKGRKVIKTAKLKNDKYWYLKRERKGDPCNGKHFK